MNDECLSRLLRMIEERDNAIRELSACLSRPIPQDRAQLDKLDALKSFCKDTIRELEQNTSRDMEKSQYEHIRELFNRATGSINAFNDVIEKINELNGNNKGES